jgi:hypothetical protein
VQLTHFRGEGFEGMDCLYVLRSARSLVECKFASVDEDIDETALLPPHLGLKLLRLTGEAVCLDILSILTLPSLAQLDFDDRGITAYHSQFVSFLARSRPPLRHLTLSRAYSRLVHGFPWLTELAFLEISALTVSEMADFWQNLRARDPGAFLPNLRSLVTSVYPDDPYVPPATPSVLDFEDLADALDWRWNRNDLGPRLESFRMTCNHTDDPPPDFRMILPRLRDLIEEGMHISVVIEVVDSVMQHWI